MVKKAVLVGCNYPGTDAELNGCINDVWRHKKMLIDRFGFKEQDITVLIDTDPQYMQPTGANIKRALDKMVSEAKRGNVLFFHYSGHGVRLPPETGDIDDTGFDECIVPCDMNLISDDDIRDFVDKLPQGVTFTIISDSCHSGGLIDSAVEQIGDSCMYGAKAGPKAGAKAGPKPGAKPGPKPGAKPASKPVAKPPPKKGGKKRDGSEFVESISESIHGFIEDRGIHLPSFSRERRGSQLDLYVEEDESYLDVPYEGEGTVKSRALPLATLLEILKQKTGKEDLDVGIIRPTLFDIFREESSSKVKKFVKVLTQGMHHHDGGSDIDEEDDDDSGSGHHHHHHHHFKGAMNALAQQFLKHKITEVDNSDEYLKPAMEMEVVERKVAYAGPKGRQPKDMGILISGCQSRETSADANPSGNASEAYGAMSNALRTVLSEHQGPITNHELVTRMRQLLQKQGFSQHPGLYCTNENAKAVFIC